jgi:hypothetical protein
VSSALTIVGGVLEVVGLGFVFVELAVIRSFEFGVPTPWAHLRAWIRNVLRRPQFVQVTGIDSRAAVGTPRLKVRPSPLDADATDAERIEWLERSVEALDKNVDALHTRIDKTAEEVTAAAKDREQELRSEFEHREEQRRQALRPSLRRQAFGGICVFAGIVLGTIGNVA